VISAAKPLPRLFIHEEPLPRLFIRAFSEQKKVTEAETEKGAKALASFGGSGVFMGLFGCVLGGGAAIHVGNLLPPSEAAVYFRRLNLR
jgi:hypothetical protein